nr:SPOR domain-containing protein [Azospirillum oleiclasticum]
MLRTPAPTTEPAAPPPSRAVAPTPAPAPTPRQAAATPPPAPAPRAAAPASTPPAAAPAAPAGDGHYAVQVGSFGVPENATALQRRLAERGFNAYALDWTDRNQRSWRVVRVGNFRTDAEARRAAEDLKTRLSLPVQVVTTR